MSTITFKEVPKADTTLHFAKVSPAKITHGRATVEVDGAEEALIQKLFASLSKGLNHQLAAKNLTVHQIDLTGSLVICKKGDGSTRTVDLNELLENQPNLTREAAHLQHVVESSLALPYSFRGRQFKKNEKGVHYGAPSLQLSDAKLKKELTLGGARYAISHATQNAPHPLDDTQKAAAFKKIEQIEKFVSETTKGLDGELKALNTRRGQATTDADKQKLDKDIASLTSLRESLQGIDFYALGFSLAADKSKDAAETVTKLRAQIHEDFTQAHRKAHHGVLQHFPSGIGDYLRGRPENSASYPQDAALLFLSALPTAEGRALYLDFCRAWNVQPKRSSMEDHLLRWVEQDTPDTLIAFFKTLGNQIEGKALRKKLNRLLTQALKKAKSQP